MTGPQVFKKVLQTILATISELVGVPAGDREWIEEHLRDELPGFIPTREELIYLVKLWFKKIIDDQWIWIYEVKETSQPNLHLAKYRIERILEYEVFFDLGEHSSRSMADEFPQFVCLRSELWELVKHLAEEAFFYDFWILTGRAFGNAELRRIDFLWSRVDRIREVLGDRDVDKIIDKVKSTLCAQSKGYDIAFNGSKEQKEAFAEEYHRALQERK